MGSIVIPAPFDLDKSRKFDERTKKKWLLRIEEFKERYSGLYDNLKNAYIADRLIHKEVNDSYGVHESLKHVRLLIEPDYRSDISTFLKKHDMALLQRFRATEGTLFERRKKSTPRP